MNSKYIVLREGYDWLNIGEGKNEISISEYKNLCVYLKKNIGNKSIVYDYNKIKFINYGRDDSRIHNIFSQCK